MDPTATAVNDNDEPQGEMPEVIKPIMLPFRPANQQQASHVLIVDDNEINLKVSYFIFVLSRILLSYCPNIMLLTCTHV